MKDPIAVPVKEIHHPFHEIYTSYKPLTDTNVIRKVIVEMNQITHVDQLEIRKIRHDEIDQTISCIHSASIANKKHYPPDFIDFINEKSYVPSWLAKKIEGHNFYVALIDGEIVGTVTHRENSVNNVFIRYNHQGKGIGRQLMNFIEGRIREVGFDTATLTSNLTSQEFYHRLGYVTKKKKVETIREWEIVSFEMEKLLK